MATPGSFGGGAFLLRLLIAAVLVFATYNPSGTSYYDWLKATLGAIAPEKAFLGVVLAIGWVFYLRATWKSLGPLGLVMTLAFFGTLLWLIIDRGLVSVESRTTVVWLVEIILVFVLAVGVSWSHVRRRLSGQVSTDEL